MANISPKFIVQGPLGLQPRSLLGTHASHGKIKCADYLLRIYADLGKFGDMEVSWFRLRKERRKQGGRRSRKLILVKKAWPLETSWHHELS